MVLKIKRRAFDFFGSVAVVNFPKEFKQKDKKAFAEFLMNENKSIKTVLEKVGKVKGRLRKLSTKYVAGEKTKEVLYRENGCVFRFNIDTTYFSPRLSNERKEVASRIKKGEKVLVMFAGVAPFSIVIAKNSKAEKVVSVEINREASKYAKLNVELNKLQKKVEVVQRDVKKLTIPASGTPTAHPNGKKGDKQQQFDVIVMARPQLKDTFLESAFKFSKKGTRIFYYGFCDFDKQDEIVEQIKEEAKKARKKIKILEKKVAGEIAPYRVRLRVDFKVL